MKKSLFALMAVALFATTAMAQVLIYDYKVSYKLVNATTKKNFVKCDDCENSKKATLDSPKVASSKLTGYMVINACTECWGDMESSAAENDAVFYFYNKSAKSDVYRSVGEFSANMFGAKTGAPTTGTHDGCQINFDKFSDASAAFTFPFVFGQNEKFAGFLGYATSSDDEVLNYGYGKVAKKTMEDDADCEDVESICWVVKSLSGNTGCEIRFDGHCSDFLFDVCDLSPLHAAPLVGSFSLKLNDKLTKKGYDGGQPEDFAEAEEVIFKKLGVKIVTPEGEDPYAKVWVPAEDSGADQDLYKGITWGTTEEPEEPEEP